MDIRQAVDILYLLKDAVDPVTGEVLPDDHFLWDAEVQDALKAAIEKMEPRTAPDRRGKNKPKAGRPWTQRELDDLRSLYEGGVSVADIARMTQRRERGVRLQLNLIAGGGARRDDRVAVPDVIEARSLAEMAPKTPVRGPVNRHHPWTREADESLAKLFQEGKDPSELATLFGRSAYAVELRLQKLGFLGADAAVRPWSKDDVAQLRHLHAVGRSVHEMATDMQRSEASIEARLNYMGLIAGKNVLAPVTAASEETEPVRTVTPAKAAVLWGSRRWTAEEDAYLRSAWAEGIAVSDMCTRLERRDRLVRCRLIFLGVCDHSVLGSAPMPPELAHQGLPWYPEETELLTDLYREKRTVAEMAWILKRSETVVRSRMELLGLPESGLK